MSNPIMRNAFANTDAIPAAGRMTLEGTIDRALLLFAILVIAAAWTWNLSFNGGSIAPYLTLGFLGGFVLVLVLMFNRQLAPYLAPVYAALEGLVLGGISAVYAGVYNGIVLQAVLVTICIMGVMFLLYRTRIIRATPRFWIGVTAATMGIALFYLADMILSFFNITIPYLFSGGGNRCSERTTEIYGVVCRLRPDGDTGVAVPGGADSAVKKELGRKREFLHGVFCQS
jgi:uncharacterized YccA/Bax inhibitor family protein